MFSSFKINKVIEQWLSWARKGIHPSPCPVIVSNTSSQSQDTGWNRTISIPEVHGTLADLAWGSHRKYHRNTEDTWGFSVCIEETRWQEGRHTCLRTRRQQPSVEGLKEREAQRGRLWRLSALLSTFPCSTFPWSHQSCQISYPLGFVCEPEWTFANCTRLGHSSHQRTFTRNDCDSQVSPNHTSLVPPTGHS